MKSAPLGLWSHRKMLCEIWMLFSYRNEKICVFDFGAMEKEEIEGRRRQGKTKFGS
jgi:hypothetical protein